MDQKPTSILHHPSNERTHKSMSHSLIPYAKRTRNSEPKLLYCNVPDCAGRPEEYSLCIKHSSALKRELKRTGKTIPKLDPLRRDVRSVRYGNAAICAVGHCTRKHKALGYCKLHYSRKMRPTFSQRIERAEQRGRQARELEIINALDEALFGLHAIEVFDLDDIIEIIKGEQHG